MKKQRFVKIKFQYKLLALFFVVFLVPIVIYGVMVTNNLEATYRSGARETAYEKMTETENGFKELRQDLQSIVDEIASDKSLCSLIDKSEEDFEKEIDYINSAELIFTNLSTAIISNESISSVYLYHSSGELHYVNYTDTVDRSYFPENEEWYQRIARNKESFFMAPHVDQQTVTQESNICSYVSPVIAEGQNGDFAVMKINFSSDEFYEKIGISEAKITGVVLLDENNKIITQKGGSYRETTDATEKYLLSGKESFSINGTQYLVMPYQLREIGWSLVSIMNETELISEITNYNAMITLFTIVMAVLLVIFSYMIAAVISRPIKGMATMTENIKRGVPGTEHNMPPMPSNFLMKDEYDSFTDTINNLVHQINESNDIRTRQEFEILQAQINPHFIYNTLNTIKWSAHMDGNERTEKAVAALINLFKSTIRVGVTYISVEEELSQLR
ncbi:MAG: histidine kinase, partial [Christensenellaceae bacterium]|nr:histidine kinase [Christensenellaceae bacterium]